MEQYKIIITYNDKVFANLVMAGQIHSALQYLNDDNDRGVLPLKDDVMRQLKQKRPEAQKDPLGTLLFGPIEEVPDVRDVRDGLRCCFKNSRFKGTIRHRRQWL